MSQQSWNEPIYCGGLMSAKHPSLFSSDSKSVFVISGTRINAFNAATSQLLAVFNGHKKEVTSIQLNQTNPLQLYSASKDGTVKLWDHQDGVVLNSWVIGDPILSMVLDPTRPSVAYILLLPERRDQASGDEMEEGMEDMEVDETCTKSKGKEKRNRGKQQSQSNRAAKNGRKNRTQGYTDPTREYRDGPFRVIMYDFHKKQTTVLFRMNAFPRQLVISPRGDFFAVNSGMRHFYLYDLNNKKCQRVTHSTMITCMAFHPVDTFVAYGDKSGKVINHYCLGDSSSNSGLKSELHWHAQPVRALAFSPDGNYMYTGGEEAVLVIWQKGTGAQQFLPRQGAVIHSVTVSSDGLHFAATLADNSIRIFSTLSLEVERMIVGIKIQASSWNWGVPKLSVPSTGLVVEPKNNLVVLNGAPGGLQFYDALADRNVSHLVVAPSPQVTTFNGTKIPETVVKKLCFSNNATHLITFDTRLDPAYKNKMTMKFWHFDYGKQRYAVNTEVENPHKQKVTGVAIHPKGQLAATCSRDTQFKLWSSVPREGSSTRVTWACQGVGYYRDSPASAVAFSGDGTLLAVAYEKEVTLWDPMNIALLRVLSHPVGNDPKDRIKGVYFIPSTHFLVTYTPYAFYVWNLLTCSIWWSYSVPVLSIVLEQSNKRSGDSTRFAVGTKEHIFLFDVHSPAPICYWSVSKSRITSLAFLPATHRSSAAIIYLNERMELVKIEEKTNEDLSDGIVESMEALDIKTTAVKSISLDDRDTKRKASESEQTRKRKEKKKEKGKEREKPSSKFERIYGREKEAEKKDTMDVDEEEEDDSAKVINPTKQFHNNIFDGPSHVIAAPSNIYMSFMENLMRKASLDEPLPQRTEPKHDEKKQETTESKSEEFYPGEAEDIDENQLLETEFDKGLLSLNRKNYEAIMNFFKETLGGDTVSTSLPAEETSKEDEDNKKKKKGKRKSGGQANDHSTANHNNNNAETPKKTATTPKKTTEVKVPSKRKEADEQTEEKEAQKKQKQKQKRPKKEETGKEEKKTPKKETKKVKEEEETGSKKEKGKTTPRKKEDTADAPKKGSSTPKQNDTQQTSKNKKKKEKTPTKKKKKEEEEDEEQENNNHHTNAKKNDSGTQKTKRKKRRVSMGNGI